MYDDIKTPDTESVEENDNTDRASDTGELVEAPVDALQELKDKLASTHERLLRTAAEFDNFRKRSRRDIEEAVSRGRTDVLTEVLPVLDSVDLALSSLGEDAPSGIVEGLQMIKRQFLSAVERFGVKPIESRGRAFDPTRHEAVSQVHSDIHPAGQVVDEMRPGYLMGERLLRPAMVMVSRGAPSPVEDIPYSEEEATDDIREGAETVGTDDDR